jgi:hypothetical protein
MRYSPGRLRLEVESAGHPVFGLTTAAGEILASITRHTKGHYHDSKQGLRRSRGRWEVRR